MIDTMKFNQSKQGKILLCFNFPLYLLFKRKESNWIGEVRPWRTEKINPVLAKSRIPTYNKAELLIVT